MSPAQPDAGALDFRSLFQSAPGLYLVLQPDLTIIAATDAYLQATMTRREDILGRHIFDVFPDNPDDPTATGVRNLRESLERVLATRRPDSMAVQKYDVRRPDSEGSGFAERHWSPVNLPILDDGGELRWIIHSVEDVTDFIMLRQRGSDQELETAELRRRAERNEAEIYRRAQEVQETNRALRESQAQLQQLNETLEERVRERTRALEAEIRDRERAEAALRETQKLEAVGRLAGGVAHDFNNLLTVIQGNAELLRARLSAAGDLRYIDMIDHASDSGARLTRQLLTFSRRQSLHPARIDLRERAADLAEMLTRSLRGDIRVSLGFADDLWLVECDENELELALINLCVNARDAMPTGGLVRIEARNMTLRPDRVRSVDLDGEFVQITIRDTGEGIPPDVLTRVFEPFFTTKEPGKGTGLGLSQVYGFAVQAGGRATIASEPGLGTTVTIYLPRVEAAADAPKATAGARTVGPSATVLLVEDDDAVAATTTQMLALLGYTAHHVRDARTALAILLGGQRFDLVFSDIVMPGGMSGLDLARKVRQHFPSISILLASGFNQSAVDVDKEGIDFIAKPYRADGLADAIRRSLAAGGSTRNVGA
ncbi:MAG: response regulator [Alphaproteobacteria bacterium]|nr:response regulator [Alphaproteobacteria bacterium]